MATKPGLSTADWQRHIQVQAQSGLSQAAYCKQQGLSLHGFHDHKYRRPAHRSSTQKPKPKPDQPAPAELSWLKLPLAAPTPEAPNWLIELDLGNGVCLRLRQN
jgi:hypothetical protein